MAVTRDFDPIAPGESEPFTLDFVDDLPSGDAINSATVTLAVTVGTDATPSARLIGGPTIIGTAVVQRVGNCTANVVYLMTIAVTTEQSNTLELATHIPCVEPY